MSTILLAAAAFTASIHGNVVSIDRVHNLLVVHHHAHEGMAMEMTMAVRLRDPRRLARLQKGEFVRLRCDQDVNPWVCVLEDEAGARST
ncbi:MAG TPA: hypothetical protein VMA36_02685 [Candidatus Limnocylindria bacterium]|nr:hypothetical protein [Candidatus Limnocylindria bacterium]